MGLEDLYFFLVASIKFLLEFSDFVVDVAFESVDCVHGVFLLTEWKEVTGRLKMILLNQAYRLCNRPHVKLTTLAVRQCCENRRTSSQHL